MRHRRIKYPIWTDPQQWLWIRFFLVVIGRLPLQQSKLPQRCLIADCAHVPADRGTPLQCNSRRTRGALQPCAMYQQHGAASDKFSNQHSASRLFGNRLI
jgi:hypothetical protein